MAVATASGRSPCRASGSLPASDAILRQHAAKLERLADELMARRWKDGADTVRIEAGELSALLDEEGRLDMEDDWLRNLAAWASNNGSVEEMWLFGSRANGTQDRTATLTSALASLRQLACGKIITGRSGISLR